MSGRSVWDSSSVSAGRAPLELSPAFQADTPRTGPRGFWVKQKPWLKVKCKFGVIDFFQKVVQGFPCSAV